MEHNFSFQVSRKLMIILYVFFRFENFGPMEHFFK